MQMERKCAITVLLQSTHKRVVNERYSVDSTNIIKENIMGIIELIIGILIFMLVLNFALAIIPIPNGIAGSLVTILILYLVWTLVF